MRKRIVIIGIAVALAIGSFVFARYRYMDRNSTMIGDATLKNPFRDKNIFGDWMKDQMVFAIVLPVAFVAGGLVWALKK